MRISFGKFLILIVMSIFGLWSSGMVLFLFYTLHNPLPFCQVGSQSSGIAINCYKVLNSSYDSIFGVPLDVLGAVYFIINLALIYIVSFGKNKYYRRAFIALFGWRFFGLFLVPYLVFLEIFVLKAICVYCTIMHVSIIVDFIIITYFLFYKKSLKSFVSKT
ncbi:MAG: vitamin K epoxide reductase family protein [Candidatus Parvarchaeota archaeon]|nr:vitamin K epoxide reductase family protein [Candidatus Parvarchaeota archaeon]